MKKRKLKFEGNYLIFIFSVLFVCVLGMVFSVSYAYISGTFSNSDSGDGDPTTSKNPYLLAEYYYNDGSVDHKIAKNGITGSVTSGGVVSLNIKTEDGQTKTVTLNGNMLTLPIKIKNVGNVKGEIFGAYASITFNDGTNEKSVSNDCGIDSNGNNAYFIQLISSTFTITNNSTLSSKNSNTEIENGGFVQIIDSLKINTGDTIDENTDDIIDSDLCGLNFAISLSIQFGQEGIETINAII